MKNRLIKLAALTVVWFNINTVFASSENIATLTKASQSKYFIANEGQLHTTNGDFAKNVLFYFKCKNLTGYLTEKGFTYVYSEPQKTKEDKCKAVKIDIELLNSTILRENIQITKEPQSASLNYYINSQVSNNVKTCNKITVKNIYPGVDWILELNDSCFKYSFSLAVGINPSIIQLKYNGLEGIEKKNNTSINLHTKIGIINEQNLSSFQLSKQLNSSYSIDNNVVSFLVADYDTTKGLIIDPSLYWSTFVGGNLHDYYCCIDNDLNGNTFVAGYSNSFNFPVANAGTYFDYSINGGTDVIISKFNSNLALVWSTFYGSSTSVSFYNYTESAHAIKVDGSGNVYVTGNTFEKRFPTKRMTGAYYDSVLNNGIDTSSSDAFLLKFSNNGTRLLATFLGGSNADAASDLAIDPQGNVYVIGLTSSFNFPTIAVSGAYNQNNILTFSTAFISKFNLSGALSWSTYFGGNGNQFKASSISIDNNSNVFVVGITDASNQLPLLNNGGYYQSTSGGQNDIFISKFNALNALSWSTFYGGTNDELVASSDIDDNNNLIITGTTSSSNFPTYTNGSSYFKGSLSFTNNSNNYGTDMFLLKFNNNGNRLWATYLGGNGDEYFNTSDFLGSYFFISYNDVVKHDKCGSIYLSTGTGSNNIPVLNGGCNSYFDDNLSINSDAFIYKFSKSNTLKWATYFGGKLYESALSLSLNQKSELYFTGTSSSTQGLTLNQPSGTSFFSNFSSAYSNMDAVIGRFNQPDFKVDINYTNCIPGCNASAQVIINSSCPQSSFSYLWNNGSQLQTTNGLCQGNNWVKIVDTANSCSSDSISFNINKSVSVTPLHTNSSCSFSCNGKASISLPGITSSINSAWHLKDTVIYNTSQINRICPGNDTLIVNIPGCGSDTSYFNIPAPPVLTLFHNAIYYPDVSLCPISCNGLINLVVLGGQQPGYCTWSNGTKGTVLDSICPGDSVTVLVTDSICYSTSETFVFPKHIKPSAQCGIINNCSSGKLFATIQNSNFFTKYKFLWTSGDTTSITKSLPPGTYSCTITSICDTMHITGTLSLVVVQPLSVKIDTILNLVPCDSICNGHANAFITGGIPKYYFKWSTGLIDSTNSLLINSDSVCSNKWIKVTVTDNCGQIASDSVFLSKKYKSKFNISINQASYSCVGSSNSQAYVNATGAHFPITYLWSNGQINSMAVGLTTDSTYSVIAIDDCGNRDTAKIKIQRASKLQLNLGSSLSCKGICNGSAYAFMPYTGISPFTYLWNTGATTLTINNTCYDTTYTCIVTDNCGTKDTASVIIGLAQPLSGFITTQASICNPNCNATATLHYAGGINTQYYYYWSNNTFSQTALNLCTDSFYYCILSTPGCGIDTFNVHIPSYPKMISSCTPLKKACDSICNGSASAQVTLGVPPYTYRWSSGETTKIANMLCVGQNYCILIDSCGKTDTAFVNILALPNPQALSNLINPSCKNICNGSASVTAFSGTPPYTYLWSTGSITSTANNLCFGANTCIVKDACMSRDTISVSISEYAMPTATASIVTSSCTTSCNGTATTIGSGGRSPYTYLWNTGTTTTTATNLCIGQNNCIVTDVCNKKDTSYVTIIAYPAFSATVNITSVSCTNQCTGSATAIGAGGKTPYTYLWSNGVTTAANATLCKGNNFCVVTDNCALKDTVNFTINVYSPFGSVLDTISRSCLNTCNAFGKVTASGGKTPYTYLWSNGITTMSTNTLCTGNNFCIATDACGIKDTNLFIVDTVPAIKFSSFSFNNTPACFPCKGAILVSIIDGWKPLTYAWSNGSTTPQLTNLCPGQYSLIVTNTYCSSDTIRFSQHIISDLQTKTIVSKNATCYDTCNGIASIKAWGGLKPFSYLWSNGFSTDSSNNFCDGTYTVKAIDSTGGYCEDTISISQPNQFNIDTLINMPHCFNPDGSIKIVVSGGTKPYQYLWSNGSTNDSINNLPEGYYTINITDSNLCKIVQVILAKGIYPIVTVSPMDTLAGLGQTIKLTASGALYYRWLNLNNLSCDTCKNTYWSSMYEGGEYCVEGIDIYGCADTACATISVFDDCGFVGLPKAFTPNGDGINDIFLPLGPCIQSIDFIIFDRWGNKVFQTNDKTFGWDGKYQGVEMPQEVYTWHLIAISSLGRKFNLKGNVTLLR